jgi:hypothetical protein
VAVGVLSIQRGWEDGDWGEERRARPVLDGGCTLVVKAVHAADTVLVKHTGQDVLRVCVRGCVYVRVCEILLPVHLLFYCDKSGARSIYWLGPIPCKS